MLQHGFSFLPEHAGGGRWESHAVGGLSTAPDAENDEWRKEVECASAGL
jgi:hypothetical protein